MSKLTQGTEIYFIDPSDDTTVIKIAGCSTFNPGGAPADQIEDTSLDLDTKTYKRGLRTPGEASASVFADPTEASHITLHGLANSATDTTVKWAVGWSDDTGTPPTALAGVFTLPSTRTWFTFDGYVKDFPLDFSTNTVVTTALAIQRTGTSAWTAASA